MLATVELAPYAPVQGVSVHSGKEPDHGLSMTWAFSGVMYLVYIAFGWWLVYDKKFAINDGMMRTVTAQAMVWSRDPHLANMGYYWMPFPTVTRIPFVLILNVFDQQVMAGPATAGLFAALTLPVIYCIGRATGAPKLATAIIIVSYALSPITIFSAATAYSETTLAFWMALVVLGYVRWIRRGEVRDLTFLGLMLAGATLSRYEALLIAPVLAVVLWATTPKQRRLPTLVLVLLPATIVMVLWTIVSALIKRDPLFWWNAAKIPTATPAAAEWLPKSHDLSSMLPYAIGVLIAVAPSSFAVLFAALSDRRRPWASLGLAGCVFAQPVVVVYQTVHGQSWATPRLFMYMPPVLAALVSLWFVRDRDGEVYGGLRRSTGVVSGLSSSRFFGWAAVVLFPVGVVTGTVYLAEPKNSWAEGEYVMMGALLGRDPDAGTAGLDVGQHVFTRSIDEYEELAADLDPELAKGNIVAMDSLSGFPLMFTSHPRQFLIPDDRDFQRIMSDPIGRVDYIVTLPYNAPNTASVLLDNAIGGTDPEGRYLLVHDYGIGKLYKWTPSVDGEVPTSPSDPGVSTAPAPGS